jgi:hypothetical protein
MKWINLKRLIRYCGARRRAKALGVFDGLYEPGYLDRLRAEERA